MARLDTTNVEWIFGGRTGTLVKSFIDDPIQSLWRPPTAILSSDKQGTDSRH